MRIFMFLLILFCSCKKEEKQNDLEKGRQSILHFQLNSAPVDYAIIQYTDFAARGISRRDTILLNKDKSYYPINLEHSGFIILSLKSKVEDVNYNLLNKSRWIYIDTTLVSIVLNEEKMRVITTKNNEISEKVNSIHIDHINQANQLANQIKKIPPGSEIGKELLIKKKDSLEKLSPITWKKSYEKYISHEISIYFLQQYYQWVKDKDPKEVKRLYEKLPSKYKELPAAKFLASNLDISLKTAIGTKIPKITLPNVNNELIELDLSNQKFTLIDFWASWCSPCRKEHPNLISSYNEFNKKGFSIVSISIDKESDKNKWIKAIKKDSLIWDNLWDYKLIDKKAKTGIHNELASKFGIKSIPANFLVNDNGIIIAKNLRGEELKETLKKLFD